MFIQGKCLIDKSFAQSVSPKRRHSQTYKFINLIFDLWLMCLHLMESVQDFCHQWTLCYLSKIVLLFNSHWILFQNILLQPVDHAYTFSCSIQFFAASGFYFQYFSTCKRYVYAFLPSVDSAKNLIPADTFSRPVSSANNFIAVS